MSETFVQARSPAAGVRYLKTHENIAIRHLALMAQGIVDIAPEIPFDVKVANMLKSRIQLPMGMKVAKCLPVPPMWFETTAKKDKLDNVTAVQIYKAPKSKQEIIDKHYDTKQQGASFQEKH